MSLPFPTDDFIVALSTVDNVVAIAAEGAVLADTQVDEIIAGITIGHVLAVVSQYHVGTGTTSDQFVSGVTHYHVILWSAVKSDALIVVCSRPALRGIIVDVLLEFNAIKPVPTENPIGVLCFFTQQSGIDADKVITGAPGDRERCGGLPCSSRCYRRTLR